MIVANFISNRPTMGETRTYEDFYKFLGSRPTRLGIVARLYPNLTASFLTDALRNVVYRDTNSTDKYRPIDSMSFEWEVETNFIKRVEFAEVPAFIGDEGEMVFKERYYEKYDIFRVDKTFQQFLCISRPERKSDGSWGIQVKLNQSAYDGTIDTDGCQIGDTTRWLGNAINTKLVQFLIVALLSN